jgi:glycosyltransferase involved in cell wall biosynthesis
LRSRRRILVLHLAGRYPLGGIGWQAIHYVVGLARLGHDVYYVEDSGAPPYDPRVKSVVEDHGYGVEFLRRIMERFELTDRWAYWDEAGGLCHGLSRSRLLELYGEADALLNLCGATRLRDEHLRCPVRMYVETDPVHEQVRLAAGDRRTREFLDAHTHHATYGENLGQPGCPIPAPRYAWTATRPPVVMDLWDYRPDPGCEALTTVATLKNVGKDVRYDGETYYWSKHVNFLRFADLPRLTAQPFEIALDASDPETRAPFQARGWRLADAYARSADLDAYAAYVQASRGEFTVAKDIYARTGSGWFSDRSVCYLASGKPVVTQDTGFTKLIPTGRGLFAFGSLEEATAAVQEINRDYVDHCRAARAVAAEYFAAETVLGDLLEAAGL